MKNGFHTQAQVDYTKLHLIQESAYARLIELANKHLSVQSTAVPDFYFSDRLTKPDEYYMRQERVASNVRASYFCALAWLFTNDTRYADKASEILNSWAETNTGVKSWYDPRLSTCYLSVGFLQAASLIWNYSTFNQNKFKEWITNVLYPNAVSVGKSHPENNWNCWSILSMITIDNLLDEENFSRDINELKNIIDTQIMDDGKMPNELKRTNKQIWYSLFALEPMTAAIEIVRNVTGENLYEGKPKKALDYIWKHWVIDKDWVQIYGSQVINPSPTNRAETTEAMGYVYKETAWNEWVEQPVFTMSGGFGWIAPTLMQPFPLDAEPPIEPPIEPPQEKITIKVTVPKGKVKVVIEEQ